MAIGHRQPRSGPNRVASNRDISGDNNGALVAYVEKKLRKDWSPEQIANRIHTDYPDDRYMRISVEAIYAWIYTATRHGSNLHRHLRRGRRHRRSHKLYG